MIYQFKLTVLQYHLNCKRSVEGWLLCLASPFSASVLAIVLNVIIILSTENIMFRKSTMTIPSLSRKLKPELPRWFLCSTFFLVREMECLHTFYLIFFRSSIQINDAFSLRTYWASKFNMAEKSATNFGRIYQGQACFMTCFISHPVEAMLKNSSSFKIHRHWQGFGPASLIITRPPRTIFCFRVKVVNPYSVKYRTKSMQHFIFSPSDDTPNIG